MKNTNDRKNIVLNSEAKATDEDPVFTPRQLLGRFGQGTKREHKNTRHPLLKRENITNTERIGKEKQIQEDFIWGEGPEAFTQITRSENKTEPVSMEIKDLIRLFMEYYLSKTKFTS